jgi:hypothetical protein
MADDPRAEYVQRIEAVRARWRGLVAEVGDDRMELPGPMGEWFFKDLASHLTAWRRRTIARLHAAARGEAPPPPPWEADLGSSDIEDDPINDWIHERTKDRPLAEVLAEADATYDDFIAAVRALQPEDLTDPRRFDWLEGAAFVEYGPGGHLDEHEPGIRRWLADDPR